MVENVVDIRSPIVTVYVCTQDGTSHKGPSGFFKRWDAKIVLEERDVLKFKEL